MGVDVHQFERILDQIELDLVVERGVGGEAGSVVDLEQDGLGSTIQHDVQPQNVETHVSGVVLRLAALVLMRHEGQSTDDGLNGHIVDLVLEHCHIDPCLLQLSKHTRNRPLMTHSHVITAIVEDELRVVLVDGIVGQVDVLLLQIGSRRLQVGFSGQSGQTLLIHIQSQRVGPAKQYVDPEVEF